MGAVAEMLRKRERRDTRKRASGWDPLWLPASYVYMMGALMLPPMGAPWDNAFVWMCFGFAWVSLVAVADHYLRRLRHRRKPAEAGKPQHERRAWRLAMYYCVLPVAVIREPDSSGSSSSSVLGVACLVIVLAETAVAAVVRRRDAQRRRREVADLARQF